MGNEGSIPVEHGSLVGRSYRSIPRRKKDKIYIPGPDFTKASVVNKVDKNRRKVEEKREEQRQRELEQFVNEALTAHNEYR